MELDYEDGAKDECPQQVQKSHPEDGDGQEDSLDLSPSDLAELLADEPQTKTVDMVTNLIRPNKKSG
jgi:hypothetical protein